MVLRTIATKRRKARRLRKSLMEKSMNQLAKFLKKKTWNSAKTTLISYKDNKCKLNL